MPKIGVKSHSSVMLSHDTPVEDYRKRYGLWVKREDLACPPPGPPFSKARGVYAWCQKRTERVIGVLDTRHSQAGHAVARACQILGKKCVNYYPEFKHEPGPREPQLRAKALGATLVGITAGRSAILYHQAKKHLAIYPDSVMIPNALKLKESVTETAKEIPEDLIDSIRRIIIPSSSGTIAAGVIQGVMARLPGESVPEFVIHLGYSRSHEEVERYVLDMAEFDAPLAIIDEGYAYKDKARPGPTPPWPCNEYYDLKAFRYWMEYRKDMADPDAPTLFWNIG